MNVFLLYPTVKRITFGGMPLGGTVLLASFGMQYIVLLLAIGRKGKSPQSSAVLK